MKLGDLDGMVKTSTKNVRVGARVYNSYTKIWLTKVGPSLLKDDYGNEIIAIQGIIVFVHQDDIKTEANFSSKISQP